MAKVKVHELAKELQIQSKEIVGFLAESEIKVTASSGLDDEMITKIKNKFKPAVEVEKEEAKKEEPKKEVKEEAAKPKKKISAVFNPQYSQTGLGKKMEKKHAEHAKAEKKAEKKTGREEG